MRTTEVLFGVFAGIVGVALGILSMTCVLPYSEQTLSAYSMETIQTYAVICIAASAVSIAGALLVLKNHVTGSVVMAVMMVVLLVFGFPWQTISVVVLIISIVLAMVPVKTHTKAVEEEVQT